MIWEEEKLVLGGIIKLVVIMNDWLFDFVDFLSYFTKCFLGLFYWVKKVGGVSFYFIGEELFIFLVV